MITVKEAHNILEDLAKTITPSIEYIDIKNSVGRTLGEDIYTYDYIPQYNKSAVDGYAVFSENLQSVPTTLKVDYNVTINGGLDKEINPNNCVYVPTGALVPAGYDAMVMVEDTILDGDHVTINKKVDKGNLIVFKGSDFNKDEIGIKKNTLITPFVITSLAFFGVKKVPVYKKLKVSIISTGDELVDINNKNSIFDVRDVNSYTLSALLENLQLDISNTYIVKDNIDFLRETLEKASKESDLIFLSGGSSVGIKDFTLDLLSEKSEILINCIKMKPGKPTIVAKGNNKVFFGLPGHPMSTTVVFKILVEPFIKKIYGIYKNEIPKKAILTKDCKRAIEKETYQMVKLYKDKDIFAEPIFTNSGFVSTMEKAEGYFIIPLEKEKIEEGTIVDIYRL